MRTLFKILGWSLFIYLVIQVIYQSGYKKSSDKDYMVGTPIAPGTYTIDSGKYYVDSLNNPAYSKKILKPDTTPYKGKWVDVN